MVRSHLLGGRWRRLLARCPAAKIRWAAGDPAFTVWLMNVDAPEFCRQWVDAWNAHDVEAVLAHFHEDVVFTSPVAARILPDTAGVVHGKSGLRKYWTVELRSVPNLRFVVDGIYQGIDTIVIAYRNQDGGQVSEVLRFCDDLVVEGHGTYLSDAVRTAQIRR
jgi:ketosteroid isomerase-like protein